MLTGYSVINIQLNGHKLHQQGLLDRFASPLKIVVYGILKFKV
jgi:hypothetical protein